MVVLGGGGAFFYERGTPVDLLLPREAHFTSSESILRNQAEQGTT